VKRWSVVFTALSLLLFTLLPACGGGGDEKTPTPAVTTPPVTTPTPTPTDTPISTPSGPVKIGVIGTWSGPVAISGVLTDQVIALVEWQVKNMGGILGGREVKFYRGDDGGIISQSVAQAKKLVLDNKVSILTLGGISSAHFTAVANTAEELKVPYVPPATIYNVADLKYSVSPTWHNTFIDPLDGFIGDVLKSKTVAWLSYESDDANVMLDGAGGVSGLRDRFKARGIDIVYDQRMPVDVIDLTPYLTKIQYLKPDVLISFLNTMGQSVTLNKQIMELGGWGNIKYLAGAPPSASQSAIRMPGALGTYVLATWMPGSDDPGMKAFEDAFVQKNGKEPGSELAALYNPIGIAIKAIELAGSDDPEKVAQALRSGNLRWDSAWGPLHIASDGKGDITLPIAQVQEGGKLVKVWP